MADALVELQNAPDAAGLTREDWLGLLVDREADRSVTVELSGAGFATNGSAPW